MSEKIKFIDLFAGIGGIRIGLENNGFKCIFSSEIDEACKKTYLENFGEVPEGDITKVNEENIPEHDILAGGFPCQAFSSAGKQKGFEDTRGTLFFDILRIAKEKRPRVLLLENVKNLKYHDKKRTLRIIIEHLKELGYFVKWEILNAKDFGVPQNRERIIIIASKDKPFDFSKLKRVNKEVAIKDILEEENNFEFLSPEEYTLLDKDKIKKQASGLIFIGYRNKKIRSTGVRPNTEHLSRVHKQPNRIYSSEGTSPTLSASEIAGRYYIYHEGKVRKLTIKECFNLMGFPKNFKLVNSNGERYKQVGNSVAIPMIEAIAEQIKEQLF